ncbi:homoserine dehydrogenase [Nonomuraea sp. JJY05]|uniref:homoserine dehydrogenase n=1 Tax=Nonomuraea sp. JJY05 TaxID=3350255 RepID=UPI00373E4725
MVGLGLVGFGAVGTALARLVLQESARIRRQHGIDLRVTGVTTRRFGSAVAESGLNLEDLLDRADRGIPQGPAATSPAWFASTCPADIIVETMPLEPFTGAAAIEVTEAALAGGRSVVSANKGPVAHALSRLRAIARQHGVCYRFESAVADGLPVFNLIERTLPAAGITEISGLLNSTSNIVLDALSAGSSLQDAVSLAHSMEITEADPSCDLDGWDTAVKLAALCAAVWDAPLKLDQIEIEPVNEDARSRAVAAHTTGRRLVSMGSVRLIDGAPSGARVSLTEVGPTSPFYSLSGTSLGLHITSRLLCPISVSSHAPTVRDTAYGLLSDVLTIGSRRE